VRKTTFLLAAGVWAAALTPAWAGNSDDATYSPSSDTKTATLTGSGASASFTFTVTSPTQLQGGDYRTYLSCGGAQGVPATFLAKGWTYTDPNGTNTTSFDPVPSGWTITFAPLTYCYTGGGQSQDVTVNISIPANALLGTYNAKLAADGPAEPGGAKPAATRSRSTFRTHRARRQRSPSRARPQSKNLTWVAGSRSTSRQLMIPA
jgi:hypothetical protein